jgi:DNA primase
VFLPAGEDPDSFVRVHGREALEASLAAAEPLVEAYLVEQAGPARTAVGRRADAAREVARVLRAVRNPLEFDVLVKLAAERLGVREEALRAGGAPETPAAARAPGLSSDRARGAEELLVELMAADPAVARRVSAENVIQDFEHPVWRRVAEAVVAAGDAADRTELMQVLPRELRDRVARRLLGELEGEDRERALADYIERIRQRPQRRLLSRLREELRAAESRGDAAAAAEAARRLQSVVTSQPQGKT